MLFIRRLSLFLIVWAAVFSTASDARTPDSVSRVQVSLFNDARVPGDTLAQAQARAEAIFAEAKIDVDWLVCGPRDPNDFANRSSACPALAWPDHLSVRIIPHGRSVASEIFGQAFVDDSGHGIYSNVYYENLVLSRDHPELSNADMLGYVIAHELGHLLLGTSSHSASGLMQASWNPRVLSTAFRPSLVFSPSQSALLRSRLPRAAMGLTFAALHPLAAQPD